MGMGQNAARIKNKKRRDGMSLQEKEQEKIEDHKRYLQNSEYYKHRARKRNEMRRQQIKEWMEKNPIEEEG